MILVTGATGLLGSKLLFDLLADGHKVRAMVRTQLPRMEVLGHYFKASELNDSSIEWVQGDITDMHTVMDAVKGVDYVFHCAGMVSFLPNQYAQLIDINATGTANIVNACLLEGVSGLCHVSSVAALGRGKDVVYDERSEWISSPFNSNYAMSKFAAEREVWRGVAEGLSAVMVNPGIIIGPGNWRNDSSALFSKVHSGLRFYTNGVNGFVSVDDVSEIMRLLLRDRIFGDRFVLVGDNMPYREVMDLIALEMGVEKARIHAGRALSGLAWRMESLVSRLSVRHPLITRETARSATSVSRYSSEKINSIYPGVLSDPRISISKTAITFLDSKTAL
ncbi:MAG: SDR family NAD(P)-dependent oxidoreductase [Bacteroidota bacterium]